MAKDRDPFATDPAEALLAARERLRAFGRQRVPARVDPEDVVQDVLTKGPPATGSASCAPRESA